MEATKADYFVKPTVEYQLKDYEAGPIPRLIKNWRTQVPAFLSKAAGTWRYVPAKEESYWSFVYISFP